MKGKGKQHPSVSGTSTSTDKDCPLLFPDIKSVDHNRQCPVYSLAVNRTEADGLSIEDLEEGLQGDLETLLAAVAKRMRLLESEIQILGSWQDKKQDRKSLGKTGPEPEAGGAISAKRAKSADRSDERPSKKARGESTGKTAKSAKAVVGRPPKSKNVTSKPADTIAMASAVVQVAAEPTAPVAPLPARFHKNDLPNKFWAMVEPFCADITNDDLKVLDNMIKAHEDEGDYYKIPPLGKHYSIKWAEEDLNDEQTEGSKLSDKKKTLDVTSSLLRKYENGGCHDDSSLLGPLTQRLVSALIEENIMMPVDDYSMEDVTGRDPSEFNASMSPRTLAKQLNIGNTINLERRIKRELEEQGILETEERSDEHPDDEVLMEMRRKMQELKAVSAHNLQITKRLQELAKGEMARQELRKKMAVADAEVMDAYRRIQTAKQKKRTPTKKERDTACKALRERASIVAQLEKLYEDEDKAC